jgi:hypothetical protein
MISAILCYGAYYETGLYTTIIIVLLTFGIEWQMVLINKLKAEIKTLRDFYLNLDIIRKIIKK